MKILFLTDNFPPEVNAPATRTYEHCCRWAKAGAQITVITCAPNFPQGKLYSSYRNHLRSVEMIDGVKVVRVWTYITANEGFIKRSLDYLSFAFSAFFAGMLEKADVIVATSPQFFTTFAGFGLSLVKRRPWVFELRDLWPESIATVGALKQGGRLYNWLEWVELFLYRRAARVVVVTPAFRESLIQRGIPAHKIDVITNGADLANFAPRPLNRELRRKLGFDEKFVIGYIGTHGMAHGLNFVLDTMARLKDRPLHLMLVGDGAEKAKLITQAAALELSNASFHDPVPKQAVADWLASCDALLVPLRRSDTFKTVIPSKIFEAAAMERPILLGVDGQARAIVEEYGAGIYFHPEDPEAFTDALQKLAGDEGVRRACATGARKLAAAYERDALAIKMLAILRRVAGRD